MHVGYEFEAGEDVTIYVQGGPAFVAVDGEETETEISGKVGVSGSLSEKLELYGEVSSLLKIANSTLKIWTLVPRLALPTASDYSVDKAPLLEGFFVVFNLYYD